jgi:hypothetical protein
MLRSDTRHDVEGRGVGAGVVYRYVQKRHGSGVGCVVDQAADTPSTFSSAAPRDGGCRPTMKVDQDDCFGQSVLGGATWARRLGADAMGRCSSKKLHL